MDCKVFQALSEEIRLRILLLLASGEINVTQLTKRLKAPQPTVSRHLKVLSDAGIVRSARKGKQVYYGIQILGIKRAGDFINRLIEAGYSKTAAEARNGTGDRRVKRQPSKSSKVSEVRDGDWEETTGRIASIGRPDMDDFLL